MIIDIVMPIEEGRHIPQEVLEGPQGNANALTVVLICVKWDGKSVSFHMSTFNIFTIELSSVFLPLCWAGFSDTDRW